MTSKYKGTKNYVGDDPLVHPVSRFWRPKEDDIPLKAWAEAQQAKLQQDGRFDSGL